MTPEQQKQKEIFGFVPPTKEQVEQLRVMQSALLIGFPRITPEQQAINSAASFGLFPNISEETLRREWQHFRHFEPDYHKWLIFMYNERGGKGRKKVKHPDEPSFARLLAKEAWPTLWRSLLAVAIIWGIAAAIMFRLVPH